MDEYQKWIEVLRYYKSTYSYPYNVTDYLASRDIVKMCCMGLSNTRIASRTRTKVEYVAFTINQFLYFRGWTVDLDFSPLAVYKHIDVNGNKDAYLLYILQNFVLRLDDRVIELSYYICEKFSKLEEELNKYD